MGSHAHVGWAVLGLGLLAGAPARAGDYYLDALHGSDLNAGTAPDQAWCTLAHAADRLGAAPGEAHVLHLAAGSYPTSRLAFAGDVAVVGAGSDATRLEGEPRRPAFDLVASHLRWEPQLDAVRLEGLTVAGAGTGVRLVSSSAPALVVRDVAFEGCQVAVELGTRSSGGGVPTIDAQLDRVSAVDGGLGVLAVTEEGAIDLDVTDSAFIGGAGDGIRTRGAVTLTVTRCRLIDNGASGIDAQPCSTTRSS